MKSEGEDQKEDQILELIKYTRANRRICPLPQKWNELWRMLPGKKQVEKGWHPPLPLILGAWWYTPALSKMLRLEEHIRYAAELGVFTQVDNYLRQLKEEEWAHLGDF